MYPNNEVKTKHESDIWRPDCFKVILKSEIDKICLFLRFRLPFNVYRVIVYYVNEYPKEKLSKYGNLELLHAG